MPTSNRRLGLFLVMLLSLSLLLGTTDTTSQAASPQPRDAGPTLNVNALGQTYPISPDIYGMNGYGLSDSQIITQMQTLHVSVERWGGNATSRYNWQTNSFNSGSDYFFEGNANNYPPSESDHMITRDRTNGAKSIITIPMMGYVSKSSDAHICGFSVTLYGAQQSVDTPYAPDCGNGVKPDGVTLLTGNNPLDTSIAVGPSFMQNWISDMIGKFGTAASGGVKIYQLDNEPSGWYETHRDIHPDMLTYDELRDKTYTYAAAIKQSDPTASTLGPSNFGFSVYADSQVPGDKDAHGGVGFSEWYLQQMKLYADQHNGLRILDYFDQHYYPAQVNKNFSDPSQYQSVTLSMAGNADTQALRLRSTRSLWDPTYYDESWIQQAGYGPIQILPVFHNWVDTNYPGTKISITEYNWGGLESINGALAQADVLGIFGRERLDLATLWSPPKPTQPGSYAFRIYRNYDGQGSQYGDTWIPSSSSDQGQLAVYTAKRSSDNALTMVVINKTGNDLTSTLNLSGYQPASTAKVYRYSSANLNAIVAQSNQAVTASGFSATYPANSITLLVVPKKIGNTLNVTSPNDDGSGGTDTLSSALMNAQANDTITLNVSGSKITLSGALPALPAGVTISGGDVVNGTCSAAQVTIDFNGQPGFVLPGGNFTLQNVLLTGMKRSDSTVPNQKAGLTNSGTGNKLRCVKVRVT